MVAAPRSGGPRCRRATHSVNRPVGFGWSGDVRVAETCFAPVLFPALQPYDAAAFGLRGAFRGEQKYQPKPGVNGLAVSSVRARGTYSSAISSWHWSRGSGGF